MSGNGAYPEEMDFLHPEIASFTRALQATLVREPDRAASKQMVGHLAEEARVSAVIAAQRKQRHPTAPARTARGWSPRRVVAVALAVAMLPLLTAGLAVAGVRLPAVAENAFQAVGVDLPNQGGSGASDEPTGADKDSDNDGGPRPPQPPSPAPRRPSRATSGGATVRRAIAMQVARARRTRARARRTASPRRLRDRPSRSPTRAAATRAATANPWARAGYRPARPRSRPARETSALPVARARPSPRASGRYL